MTPSMKFHAILIDPGDVSPERMIQTFSNSLDDIHQWAFGEKEGGLERPRGVLEKAKSPDAIVEIYALEARLVNTLRRGVK